MIAPVQRSVSSAVLLKRCPRCREGRVFRGPFSMNPTCPFCGLRFDRGQPGYFTGAMYASYGLGIPLIALVTLGLYFLSPGASLFRLVMTAWAVCLPTAPWIWQYSRVLWVHFDRAIDPEDTDDGPDPNAG